VGEGKVMVMRVASGEKVAEIRETTKNEKKKETLEEVTRIAGGEDGIGTIVCDGRGGAKWGDISTPET